MQVQTTTITTETINAAGADFQVKTYEMKITAFCDCCDNQATGTEKQLKTRGWYCGRNEQFCPNCNE